MSPAQTDTGGAWRCCCIFEDGMQLSALHSMRTAENCMYFCVCPRDMVDLYVAPSHPRNFRLSAYWNGLKNFPVAARRRDLWTSERCTHFLARREHKVAVELWDDMCTMRCSFERIRKFIVCVPYLQRTSGSRVTDHFHFPRLRWRPSNRGAVVGKQCGGSRVKRGVLFSLKSYDPPLRRLRNN